MAYIIVLILSITVLLLGIIIEITAYRKHIERSKKTGKTVIELGILFIVVAVAMLYHEQQTHATVARQQAEQRQAQIREAELIHLDKKDGVLSGGKYVVNVTVSKNTTVKVSEAKKLVQDITYPATDSEQTLQLTFVVAGKYTIVATRGEMVVKKTIVISKDKNKKLTNATTTVNDTELSSEVIVDSTSDSAYVYSDSTVAETTDSSYYATDSTYYSTTPTYTGDTTVTDGTTSSTADTTVTSDTTTGAVSGDVESTDTGSADQATSTGSGE